MAEDRFILADALHAGKFGAIVGALLYARWTQVEYMEGIQLQTVLGLAMVCLGVVQTGYFARQSEWIPIVLGLLYSAIGIAYLWAEVYTAAR